MAISERVICSLADFADRVAIEVESAGGIRMVGGTVIDEPNNKYVAVDGRSGPRIEQFLPQHQDNWVAAIERVIAAAARFDSGRFEESAC